MSTEGLTKNLLSQIYRLTKGTNKNSKETRHRYKESNERFAHFLAEKFHIQKITNVKEKHFTAYAEHMVQQGYSGKTIRTDLSGIRYFHELSGSRFRLPENKELAQKGIVFPDTKTNTVDRAWSQREIERAKIVATSMGRHDVVVAIDISHDAGLRINEVSSLRISQVKQALDQGHLHIKGKGGVERDISIRNEAQTSALERALEYAKSEGRNRLGDYVLAQTRHGGVLAEKTSLQNWIINHRDKFQDDRSYFQERSETQHIGPSVKEKTDHVTWHGLRYTFAQERYAEALETHIGAGESQSYAEYHARVETSYELGHFRDSITKIYLS